MEVTYTGLDARGWREFNKHLPVLMVEDAEAMFAYDEHGNFLGGGVFDNWTQTSVQVHWVIVNPMVIRHGFFDIGCGYVFGQRNKKVVYGLVPGNNAKSIKLIERMGGTILCRCENAFAEGVDSVIMELKRENCTYKMR